MVSKQKFLDYYVTFLKNISERNAQKNIIGGKGPERGFWIHTDGGRIRMNTLLNLHNFKMLDGTRLKKLVDGIKKELESISLGLIQRFLEISNDKNVLVKRPLS